MRMKFFEKKILNIIFSRLVGKSPGKRNHYQVMNAFCFQQSNFFIKRGKNVNGWPVMHHFSWMWMKSNDNGFTIYFGRLFI